MTVPQDALHHGEEPASHESLRFLTASQNRIAIIDRLADCPAAPADLVAAVDCSRASVHRHLTALAERDWVEKTDGRYRLMDTGRRVRDAVADCATRLATVERFAPLLSRLDRLALDASTLAGTTLTVANEERPYAPVDRYVDRLDATETATARCVLPLRCSVLERPWERLLDADTTLDLIVGETVAHDDLTARAAETASLSVKTVPGRPPAALTVTDEWAFVAAHDGTGRLVAAADGDSEPFLTWCCAQFRRLGHPADAAVAVADD